MDTTFRKNSKWLRFIEPELIPSIFDIEEIEEMPEGIEDTVASDDATDSKMTHESLLIDLYRVLRAINLRQAEIVCLSSGIDPICLSMHSKNAEDCFKCHGKNGKEISFAEIAPFYGFTRQRISQLYQLGLDKIRRSKIVDYLK